MVTKLTNRKFVFKSKITSKIFWYTCSLLFFNFLLVSIIGNIFLRSYTVYHKEQYLYDIYSNLVSKEHDSEEFKNEIKTIQYENIYILCYDYSINTIMYSNSGNINKEINKELIKVLNEKTNE